MRLIIFIFTFLTVSCGYSQNKEKISPRLVGGPCEGCEAIFEYSNKELTSVDTLPDFNEQGLKIKISDIIYKNDGKTPAKDVILYVYHTNQNGIYAPGNRDTGWAKRHGHIRGWIKTDNEGRYTFYTLKPGLYPDRSSPAHIHTTILESDGKYYWIGSYHFREDPFLTQKEISPENPRGGSSGLLTLKKEGNIWVGTRDIVLGKNVSNYN